MKWLLRRRTMGGADLVFTGAEKFWRRIIRTFIMMVGAENAPTVVVTGIVAI